jgi:hypothetical protein
VITSKSVQRRRSWSKISHYWLCLEIPSLAFWRQPSIIPLRRRIVRFCAIEREIGAAEYAAATRGDDHA